MNKTAVIPFAAILTVMLFAAAPARAGANYVHKPPRPDQNIAAKIGDQLITVDELSEPIGQEIYEAEKKIYDLRMEQLKKQLIDSLVRQDPRSKGMGTEVFLDKYILRITEPSAGEITTFILDKKVPQSKINSAMRERVKVYLINQQREKGVDKWLAETTRDQPVEVYLTRPAQPVIELKLGDDDQSRGPADAPVTIVEFSEFQCPYCSAAAGTLDEVRKKYGSKVRFVLKNFPLPMHEHARSAAAYGLCANEQSPEKFWQLHDRMFDNQDKLDEDSILGYAKEVGLETGKLKSCVADGRFADKINRDLAEGKRVGVNSTPTFFINGKKLKGSRQADDFYEIIDQELAK